MKYLLLTKHRAWFKTLPRETVIAAREYIRENKKSGVIESVYVFPGGGGMTVFNADSHEHLMEMLTAYPLFSAVEFEVRPLAEVESYFRLALGEGKAKKGARL
jgi:muconolactone delta-isomerase